MAAQMVSAMADVSRESVRGLTQVTEDAPTGACGFRMDAVRRSGWCDGDVLNQEVTEGVRGVPRRLRGGTARDARPLGALLDLLAALRVALHLHELAAGHRQREERRRVLRALRVRDP